MVTFCRPPGDKSETVCHNITVERGCIEEAPVLPPWPLFSCGNQTDDLPSCAFPPTTTFPPTTAFPPTAFPPTAFPPTAFPPTTTSLDNMTTTESTTYMTTISSTPPPTPCCVCFIIIFIVIIIILILIAVCLRVIQLRRKKRRDSSRDCYRSDSAEPIALKEQGAEMKSHPAHAVDKQYETTIVGKQDDDNDRISNATVETETKDPFLSPDKGTKLATVSAAGAASKKKVNDGDNQV